PSRRTRCGRARDGHRGVRTRPPPRAASSPVVASPSVVAAPPAAHRRRRAGRCAGMTPPPAPGSSRPAGRAGDRTGNSTRAVNYDRPDLDEDATEATLVTSPGHGGVAVFQAPQPARKRPPAPTPGPGPMSNAAALDA